MPHSFQQIAPTDHFSWHAAYMNVYERLFRTAGPGAVLEIGCDGGGGILSYADHYSQNAGLMLPREFVACDLSSRPPSLDADKRIRHHQLNAYQAAGVALLSQYAPYAVIVDDGPHTTGSQVFFVENY